MDVLDFYRNSRRQRDLGLGTKPPANGTYPPGGSWRGATLGGDGGVVPAAATVPAPAGPPASPAATSGGNPFLATADAGHARRRAARHFLGNWARLLQRSGARSGGNTTSAPTRPPASPRRSGPNRQSSIGYFARRATRYGTMSRSASSALLSGRCGSTTRRRCRPWWQTSSIASSPAQGGGDADLQPPHRHDRQPQLARHGPSHSAAHSCANARRLRVGALEGRRCRAPRATPQHRNNDYREHSSPRTCW